MDIETYVVFTYVLLVQYVMLLMLSYAHIIASHNDFSYCVLLPLILLIMAVFFRIFFPNKIRPKNV